MKEHDATEIAYKNGYNKGARDVLEEIERIILDNTYPDFNSKHKPVNVWKATTGYDAFYKLKKKYIGQAVDNAERCVSCGEIIPEGRQVCPTCEKQSKYFSPEDVRRMTAKDVADNYSAIMESMRKWK